QKTDPDEPLAALAWVEILLSRNDPAGAMERLKAVDLNQAGILKEIIIQKIQSLSPDIPDTPATESSTGELPPPRPGINIEATLKMEYDDKELPLPKNPQNFIQCRLKLDKDSFGYADPIIAQIYLSNISDIELFLGPGSFLDPHIFITAEIQAEPITDTKHPANSTDRIPGNMILPLSHRYLNKKSLLAPNRSVKISEPLNIGPLRDILQRHPQHTYHITFRLYLDPVDDGMGGIVGRIHEIQPEPVTITRKAFNPTQENMTTQQQFVLTGNPDERIRVIHLLKGLITEAHLIKKGDVSYPARNVDVNSVKTMIDENLKHPDFRVRCWSAYALRGILLNADETAAAHLANLLSDSHWLVRFMTVYALEPVADLTEYLQWSLSVDQNEILRRYAQLILNLPWDIIEIPIPLPEKSPDEQTASER
ncbi:MAG: HEAT repeat domain-containing protein, partial [Sedimentisphaerales bacterium]|nr:HEAT repeat domain-containing protein [Sedimentisphaerales bacterium]